MYEFDFGSELITLHSRTPLHLLDEGILANGRLVFASVPHADSSHATVLDGTLRCATRETLCSAFSDELWEISVLYRIRGSGCHVEDSSTIPTASPPHNYTHLTTARGSRSPICRTLHTLGTFTPPLGSTRTAMDISRNLPSLLVKGRNVCRVEGGCLVSV